MGAIIKVDLRQLSEALRFLPEMKEVGAWADGLWFSEAPGLDSEDVVIAEHVYPALAAIDWVLVGTQGVHTPVYVHQQE